MEWVVVFGHLTCIQSVYSNINNNVIKLLKKKLLCHLWTSYAF